MLLRVLSIVALICATHANDAFSSTTEESFSTTASRLSTTEEQFSTDDGQFSTSGNSFSTTEEAFSTTKKTFSSTEEAFSPEQPLSTTEESFSTTQSPLSTTGEPLATTEESHSTTEKSISTTEEQFSTTEKSLSTTEEPLSTTEKLLTTTEESHSTTEKAISTTEKQLTTTEALTTTEEPLTTTEKPLTTTEETLTTTVKAISTTDEPLTTTEKPLTTTEETFSTAQPFDNPCASKQLTGCDDVITSCALVFPIGADGSASQKCFNPDDGDFSMTTFCRKTCQLCCQESKFACEDDPIPNVACPTSAQDCNTFGDLSFEHCKSSCGWCTLDAKPCVDLIPTCANLKAAGLCSEPEVSSQCEKTCHVCFEPGCVDSTDRCDVWTRNGFCSDSFYTANKADYCKKSCDLC